jgi:glutamyl-Q tRNA(Asp) synthetase
MIKFNTRFAPSPNGYLHLGHAYSALVASKLAQISGGKFFIRIEDIDLGRCKKEYEENIYKDLNWLEIKYEENIIKQSECFDNYERYVKKLRDLNLIYPCWASRSEIKKTILKKSSSKSSWPIDPDGQYIYPEIYKNISKAERSNLMLSGSKFSWRLHVKKAMNFAQEKLGNKIFFEELGLEPKGKRILEPNLYGDFIIARKEIPTSYHLSVTVDDAEQGINLVTRGLDIYPATSIHRLLQIILNLPETKWYHHNLLREDSGEKLSKTNKSTSIKSLRDKKIKKDEIFSLIKTIEPFPDEV